MVLEENESYTSARCSDTRFLSQAPRAGDSAQQDSPPRPRGTAILTPRSPPCTGPRPGRQLIQGAGSSRAQDHSPRRVAGWAVRGASLPQAGSLRRQQRES